MPRVRDLLYRFRPAGVPGAASPAGVPTDRAADLATELAPALDALGPTEDECAAIVESARAAGRERGERDAAEASAIVESARARLQAERADVIARLRAESEQQSEEVLRSAREQAEAVRTASTARLPEYVASVVAAVEDLIDGIPGGPTASAPERTGAGGRGPGTPS